MSEMGIKTAITTSNGVTMVTEMIGVGCIYPLKIGKLLLGMVEVVSCAFRLCVRKLCGDLILVMSTLKSFEVT